MFRDTKERERLLFCIHSPKLLPDWNDSFSPFWAKSKPLEALPSLMASCYFFSFLSLANSCGHLCFLSVLPAVSQSVLPIDHYHNYHYHDRYPTNQLRIIIKGHSKSSNSSGGARIVNWIASLLLLFASSSKNSRSIFSFSLSLSFSAFDRFLSTPLF